MHESMCSGSKFKFSSWCRRPSWIWPSDEKCMEFWEGPGAIFLQKVRRSRISHKNMLTRNPGHGIEVLDPAIWNITLQEMNI